ncbi:MAG: MFS transporter [Senegalia sp. (in: firmicutes)]|uniref:MFS transporter n=1 Tax=Senegalia sp. (in: firmicutes) TaxID=1924098 RepID=UPI003F997A17
MRKIKNKTTIVFLFSLMILVSMGDNLRGVFIPVFKGEFNVDDTGMGLMLIISSLGYMIFTFIGGVLCDKIGQRKVLRLGMASCIISLLLLFYSPNFTVLLIGMFIINMGVSLIVISVNTLIPLLAISFQAILMNMIHSFYGVGATITQRGAGLMLYNGFSFRSIYLILISLFLLAFIISFGIKIPEKNKDEIEKTIQWNYILKNKLTYFYILALGLYISAEMSTANWFINFMQTTYNFDANKSALYSSVFLGIFTIGRFFGGFVVEKVGHFKSVVISLSLATFIYTTGLILGSKGLLMVSISGIFFSIIFPTIVVTISKVFPRNSSFVTGIVVSFASGISMIVNFLIGYFNDLIGTQNSFYIIPISLLISTVFSIVIFLNTKSIRLD